MKGKVKFYNVIKSFGFITGEDDKDYFVHRTGLTPGTKLYPDDEVEFDLEETEKGPKAVNVRKLESESKADESEGSPEVYAEDMGDSSEDDEDNEDDDEED